MALTALKASALAAAMMLPLPAFAGGKQTGKAKKPVAAKPEAKPAGPTHEFADVALATVQVLETRGEAAVVAGKKGGFALVRIGDLLGEEALAIETIAEGCLVLRGEAGPFSLCVDAPEVPRS